MAPRTLIAAPLLALLTVLSASASALEVRASELLGKPVATAGGQPLGRIADVLLDARKLGVHYAVLDSQRRAYRLDQLHAAADGALRVESEAKPAPAPDIGDRYVSAARILFGPVDDPLGNEVGTLRDVVLDLDTGRSRYFVVAFDGQEGTLPLAPHSVRLHRGNPTVHGDRSRRA